MPSLRPIGEKMKKYRITNVAERDMLKMYCAGKGWLWNKLYGCRAYMRDEETGDWEYSIYAVPLNIRCEVAIRARHWESAKNIDIEVKEISKNS